MDRLPAENESRAELPIVAVCSLALMLLLSACDDSGGAKPTAAKHPQIYSSIPGPNDCVASPSLKNLEKRTNAQLWKLVDTYTFCQDDIALASRAQDLIFEELMRRKDPLAPGALAQVMLNRPGRYDREKVISLAREAARLGDPSGERILAEMGLK